MYDAKFGEIYHHGIRGQKWGERNGPPYPLGSRKSGSERYYASKSDSKNPSEQIKSEKKGLSDTQKKVLAGAAIAGVVLAGAVATTYIVKDSSIGPLIGSGRAGGVSIDSLSKERKTIPKGTKIQRISSKKLEEYENGDTENVGRAIYAAFDETDKVNYMREMPYVFKRSDPKAKSYIHKQKLVKDVRLASERDLFDAVEKCTKNMHPDKLQELGLGYTRLDHETIEDSDGTLKTVVKLSVDGFRRSDGKLSGARVDGVLNNLFTAKSGAMNELKQDVTKELTSSGFDGLVDPNDSWANSPLILLNASEAIGSKESKGRHLTKADEIIAVLRL